VGCKLATQMTPVYNTGKCWKYQLVFRKVNIVSSFTYFIYSSLLSQPHATDQSQGMQGILLAYF